MTETLNDILENDILGTQTSHEFMNPQAAHLPNDQPNNQRLKLELKVATHPDWTSCILNNLPQFLLDHAACEKKASGFAVSMVSHYPDKTELVRVMCNIAVEEMVHFREVVQHIQRLGLTLSRDEKDPYIAQLLQLLRKGTLPYFMDRLLIGAIIEARGAERFALIAQGLKTQSGAQNLSLEKFYTALAQSEARHFQSFLDLALLYFETSELAARLEQLLTAEADIIQRLPIRPALH